MSADPGGAEPIEESPAGVFQRLPLWAIALVPIAWSLVHIVLYSTSPRVWLDEMLVFTTAYDLVHWDRLEVPHGGFLFYRPLPSLLLVPVHAAARVAASFGFEMPMSWLYRAGLLAWCVVASTSAILAAKLHQELFGTASRAVALVVALASPALFGLVLMTEAVYIPLVLGHLLFVARYLVRRRNVDALLAGLCACAMVLTRPNGILIVAPALILPFVDRLVGRGESRGRPARADGSWWLGVVLAPIVVHVGWGFVQRRWADPTNHSLSMGEYGRRVADHLGSEPGAVVDLLAKLSANGASLALGSLGLAVPLIVALWVARDRPTAAPLGVLVIHLAGFAAATNAAAVAHMVSYGEAGASGAMSRYLMYGRYLAPCVPPIMVLGLGATRWLSPGTTAGGRSSGRRTAPRRIAVAATGLVAAICVAALPVPVLDDRIVGPHRHVSALPNQVDLAWALEIWRMTGSKWLLAAVASAFCAILVALWSRPEPTTPAGRTSARRPSWIWPALVVALVPLVGGMAAVSKQLQISTALWKQRRIPLSLPMFRDPELRRIDMCLELPSRAKELAGVVQVAYFDHLPRLVSGRCRFLAPELPMISVHSSDSRSVLYRATVGPPGRPRARRNRRPTALAVHGPAAARELPVEIDVERLGPTRLRTRFRARRAAPRVVFRVVTDKALLRPEEIVSGDDPAAEITAVESGLRSVVTLHGDTAVAAGEPLVSIDWWVRTPAYADRVERRPAAAFAIRLGGST